MDKQWIDSLRKRFEDRQQPAPDGLWDSINAAMTERGLLDETQKQPERKAKVVPIWIRRVAAAAACVAIIIGAAVYLNRQENPSNLASISTSTLGTTSTEKQTSQKEPLERTSQTDEKQSFMARTVKRLTAMAGKMVDRQRENINQETAAESAEPTVLIAKNESAETENAVETNQNEPDKNQTPNVWERYTPPVNHNNGNHYTKKRQPRKSKKVSHSNQDNVTFGLYGGGASAIDMSFGGYDDDVTYLNDVVGAMDSRDYLLFASALVSNKPTEQEPKLDNAKHHQPLKIGFTARLRLTDRLGVETGLFYSYLSSDFSSSDVLGGTKTQQKLHYAGIPLKLSYSMWRTDLLEVYAGAGGAVEFCVNGNAHTDWIYANEVVKSENRDAREKRPQFSVNASAGVQYNISDLFGVYAEPGVSYYIDNGSQTKNFYKDKQWNFNLNVGLRLTFK